ncbi:metalloprotease ATP23 [Phycomyces nitens]|nr:metalloprotease ATP23 [Phycomyces nitens]
MTESANEKRSLKDMKLLERWSKSFQYMVGNMGTEEATRFKSQLDGEIEEYQCKQCETWKENLIKNSPPVRFMMEELRKEGKPIKKDDFICSPCDEDRSGGYNPEIGVLLCQNKLNSKAHQERTMVHEMVHMYDDQKFKVDWMNLRHHACSEVRAASLGGDCGMLAEFGRGFYSFTKQHQACVKRRAVLSLLSNPSCESREDAERAVASVFDSCFADTRPFDEIY